MPTISIPVTLRVEVPDPQYIDAIRNYVSSVVEHGSVRDSIDEALSNAKPQGFWDNEAPSIDALYVPESGDAPTPRILRVLDLVTNHLPMDVCDNLNSYPGVQANEHSYGWFMWVPTDDIDAHVQQSNKDDPYRSVPEAVIAIWRYARNHECDYVLFDRDARVNGDLPTWEW